MDFTVIPELWGWGIKLSLFEKETSFDLAQYGHTEVCYKR